MSTEEKEIEKAETVPAVEVAPLADAEKQEDAAIDVLSEFEFEEIELEKGSEETKKETEEENMVKISKDELALMKATIADFEALRNDPEFVLFFNAKTQGVSIAGEMIKAGVFTDWDKADEKEVFLTHSREVYAEDGLSDDDLIELYDNFTSKSEGVQKAELIKMRKELKAKASEKVKDFGVEHKPNTGVNQEEEQKKVKLQLQTFCGSYSDKEFEGLRLSEEFEEINNVLLNLDKYITTTDDKGNRVPNVKQLARLGMALSPKLRKKQFTNLLSASRKEGAFAKKAELANPGAGISGGGAPAGNRAMSYDERLKAEEKTLEATAFGLK